MKDIARKMLLFFKRCYISTVKMKGYVIIGGKNFLDQPVIDNIRTYESIIKIMIER